MLRENVSVFARGRHTRVALGVSMWLEKIHCELLVSGQKRTELAMV